MLKSVNKYIEIKILILHTRYMVCDYRIDFLHNQMQHLQKAADWAYKNWYLDSEINYNLVLLDYSKRASISTLPVAFIAVNDRDQAVGMVSLKKTDLQERKDLGPWLSALYVDPDYRNIGIGKRLIINLLNFCKIRNINRLYLFVDKKNEEYLIKYYEKIGWKYLCKSKDHNNQDVKIYFFENKL